MNGLNYNFNKNVDHHRFFTLEETIRLTLLARLCLSIFEVVEKTKQLRASIITTSLENYDEKVCLVEKDSPKILEESLEDDYVEEIVEVKAVNGDVDGLVKAIDEQLQVKDSMLEVENTLADLFRESEIIEFVKLE